MLNFPLSPGAHPSITESAISAASCPSSNACIGDIPAISCGVQSHSLKRAISKILAPIHSWSEQQVWETMRRQGGRADADGHGGWSRLSCRGCIFGLPNQWASLKAIDPGGFSLLLEYEREFGVTIHRSKSIEDMAVMGKPFVGCGNQQLIEEALDRHWNRPIILPEGSWQLPPGAFTRSGGPA